MYNIAKSKGFEKNEVNYIITYRLLDYDFFLEQKGLIPLFNISFQLQNILLLIDNMHVQIQGVILYHRPSFEC